MISGSTTIEANSSSAFNVSSSTPPRMPKASTVTEIAFAPGMFTQAKSVPSSLLLTRQTPFIQSPWICISASPLITMLVVSFQARLTQPGSICSAILRKVSMASRNPGSSKTVSSGCAE